MMLGNENRKNKRMDNRIVEYYKKFGAKKFIKHCIKKVIKFDEKQYEIYRKYMLKTEDDLQKERLTVFEYMPKISIVVPLYKTPEKYLKQMIESVYKQTYSNWELCMSDGSGINSPIEDILSYYEKKDKRIKVCRNDQPLRIAENTNKAIGLCGGEYIAFMDHDDMLSEDALFCCVKYMNEVEKVDLLYTDEDKVSEEGEQYFQPHFKSDFNKDLLLAMNYICHFVLIKKSLLNQVGSVRPEYDGAQDYDLLLRCIEKTKKIGHIPQILYHWRAHEQSTAKEFGSKNYAVSAGQKALQDYFFRNSIDAEVEVTEYDGIYRTRYALCDEPKVSIIIPNKDHIEDLKKCLSAIEKNAGYENYEILILENNSVEKNTFLFYDQLKRESEKIRILYWSDEFNYAKINNWGALQAKGSLYLFLNNDVEWITEFFLKEMVSVIQRDDVGIVGNLLYYPDNIIQHAGVILGYSGIAGHAFIGQSKGERGYFSRIVCMQDYSAVTAACMLVKADLFHEVQGFDEKFKIAFNDVDFCLKVREKEKLVIYDPYIEAYHYESKSRGSDEKPENKQRFEQEKSLLCLKWKGYIEDGDPYYNVNLSRIYPDFRIGLPNKGD